MNTELLPFALTQFLIAILVSTVLLFSSMKLLEVFIAKRYQISYNNLSYAIFAGATLFACAFLFQAIEEPVFSVFRILKRTSDSFSYLEFMQYLGVFVLVGSVGVLLVISASILIFTSLTKTIDEFAEISANNIAVSVLTSAIIIAIAYMVKDSLSFVLETFVPYPSFEDVH